MNIKSICKFTILGCIAIGMASCAKLDAAWQVATGATVTTNTVYVFENAYIALENTATNYVSLPSCNKPNAPKVCSNDAAVKAIIPAVKSLRAANAALIDVQKNHPDKLGSSGVFDLAKAAYNTLLVTLQSYGVTK